MNHTTTRAPVALLTMLGLALALSACAGSKPAALPVPPPAPVRAAPALGLNEGIALYDKGDYNGAIRRLAQADVATGPHATQLAAFKYSAFSYCLSNRALQCRQQFDKALKLDPAFDLSPGEAGHPLWGPVFAKAKKGK